MMLRRALITTFLLAAFGGGVAAFTRWAGEALPPPRPTPAARLESRGWADADLWPVSKSWVWTVEPIGTKRKSSVCVRTVKAPIPPGTEPSHGKVEKLPPAGEDRRTGWTVNDGKPASGRVTCQLIDVREAGLGEPKDANPLRLLVRFRSGGGMSGLTGPKAILPGDQWVGLNEYDSRWEGDALLLLTVHTRTTDTLFSHHVFVEQSDRE